MGSIVVLLVTAVSAVTALFTVTGGTSFVIAGAGILEWQRRKGFKGGEGGLSPREAGHPYSTYFDENSDHDLSMDLGRLAHVVPEHFKNFINKKYDFTKTEGQLLRAIVKPPIVALDQVEGIKAALEEDPQNEDLQQLFMAAMSNVGLLLEPVVVFLQQFPSKRVKQL